MANEVWALDLGEWSIKVARGHLDKKSGKMVLGLYDEIRFDALGLGEESSSLEKYRAGLEEFQDRHTVGPSDDLCVAVSGSEVFSRFINLPPVPESISEIISYEARQQIPFDIDDVVWDYQPLKEEHQPGEEIEVGLFALKRETIDEFMEILEPWRHNLRVIQNGPLAVYNFLVYEGRTDDPTIVLDMGARSTDVLVLNHPRFWLRPLLIGGNGITERLQSHFGVSWREAERIKERASERERQAQLLRVVRPVVGNVLSEIQRSLGYYKSLAKGVQIQKILAVGNAFKLRGLDRVLADGLQYDVERLRDLRNFELESSVDEENFTDNLGGACTVLGLLVQGVDQAHIDINLVPEELAAARVMRKKKPWVAGAVAALLVVVGILWGSEMSYSKNLTGNLDEGKQVLNRVERMGRAYSSARSEAQGVEEKVRQLADRKIDRDTLLEIMPPMVHALPEDRVFARNMEFVWMSPSDFETALETERMELESAAGTGTEGEPEEDAYGPGRAGRPGPGSYGGPGPGSPSASRGGYEYEGRTYAAPTGLGEEAGAIHGEDSVLVLKLSCESTVISRALQYVQNEVVQPLSDARSAKDGQKVLSEVHLVGRPQNVFRRSRDGTLVESPGGEEDLTQFVAFQMLARVNLGNDAEESESP